MGSNWVNAINATQGGLCRCDGHRLLTSNGWDVSIPLTESAAYDLVVDVGGVLSRVQCKFMGGRQVGLRQIHTNSQGYRVKYTEPDAYDWLYILAGDGRQFLIRECLSGRNAVTPKIEHLLGAVAESG